MNDGLVLRAIRDADGDQLVHLVGAAYAEYPGCVLDLPDLDDDLPVPATTAARRGGRWWVVEDVGTIVASVGTGAPDDDGRVELKRLYVAASHRRRGLAGQLVRRVEAQAAGIGASHVVLWSDTRFHDAHRLYERHGYADTGARRDLDDPSHTTEICFEKPVAPAAPTRTVGWEGPFGAEHVDWYDLPDGVVFRGNVEPSGAGGLSAALGYEVEVDAAWRTRRARLETADDVRVLHSDGHGRWWRNGQQVTDLEGCLDVDLEASPVTNTLPLRRARGGPVRAAWLRVPGPAIEPLEQSYAEEGEGRWTYRSAGGFVGELAVDEHGLVTSYAQRHADGATSPVWIRV
ncbi:putative glycolipid-binding domain-containing protein [Egicoccus sp. AB-alg6-2]|uniref:putative glycolipid-binding domain-containing protein n=1 Tax=Egicoccus sp. AB-alg6-2 TaxID=3242692 RepID=UPI00359ECECA